MANLREIKGRIDSVTSTMQVTRTMEMISTARIRKALDRAEEASPYKDAITRMLANVASSDASIDHPLLARHFFLCRPEFWRIVGNIHDNPELLTSK